MSRRFGSPDPAWIACAAAVHRIRSSAGFDRVSNESYLGPSIKGFTSLVTYWHTLQSLAKEHLTGTILQYLPLCGAARGKTTRLARERRERATDQPRLELPDWSGGRAPSQRGGNKHQLPGTHEGSRRCQTAQTMRPCCGRKRHMILTGRRAAPLTLFSALRRPDREREGSGAHALASNATRLELGGLRAKRIRRLRGPDCRRSRSTQTPGEAMIPHSRRQRRLRK